MAEPAHAPDGAFAPTLLEVGFPYREISQIARADRTLGDPVYAAHKWWARRPRAVIRALVVAASMDAEEGIERFWVVYGSDGEHLKGHHVGDLFVGGGTTLVEAARLGASVTGVDVDPLAVRIATHELADPAAPEAIARAGEALLEHLRERVGELYPGCTKPASVPLHYFRLRRYTCPCGTESLLYRTPVLARDIGRAGAARRDAAVHAFCPTCRAIHRLDADAKSVRCCGGEHALDAGTFGRSGHRCPGCSTRRRHEQLRPALLPEELIAVEETVEGEHRRLRAPDDRDRAALERAAKRRAQIADRLPDAALADVDGGRPASYGFTTVSELFGDRQALVLRAALDYIAATEMPEPTAQALELAVSNAVASSNRLCGYATDYGRLAPAFTGVRSYAMPVLAVELNPLHPTAGRGTLAAMIARVTRSATPTVRRRLARDADEPAGFRARRPVAAALVRQSAEDAFPAALGACDAIVTDPPYFDYINYSDLSLLHRAWLDDERSSQALAGAPIYPVGEKPQEIFARRLGRALGSGRKALKRGGVMAFTYHSPHADAWDALAAAVARARLKVTAALPVWADARSTVSHGHPGSCEWDMVWICRPAGERSVSALPESIHAWLDELDGALGAADQKSLKLGLAAAHQVNARRSARS